MTTFQRPDDNGFFWFILVALLIAVVLLYCSSCATYNPDTLTVTAFPFTSAEIPTEHGPAKIDVKIIPSDINLQYEEDN